MSDLPKGWASVSLDEVFEPRSTRVAPSGFPDLPYIGLEQVEAQTGKLLGTVPASNMSSSAAAFRAGDVLYGRMRPYLNKVLQPQFDGLSSAEFIVFPALRGIDNRFIRSRLSASDFVEFACSQYEGDRPRVKFDQLGKFQLALPPAAEQTRIVEKLEELLSDLDAGVAELKEAQKKLAQYRQSLLKAAVEGALTTEWRQQHPPTETGAQLLQRILTERRARWEARQLAKFKEQGKTLPKDWQKKYPEPVQPDTSGLPELPQGWIYASLDQLLLQLRSGSAETSIREVTDFPVLKSSAVRPGVIDYRALNYLSSAQSRIENRLASGDLLISRLSGSVEYVGCCAQVNELPHGGVQYPDRLFCGKLVEHTETLGPHIVICFSSPHARAKIEKAAKSTAGHKRISLSDLHPFAIALPPLNEAQVLIRIVESTLGEVSRQEASIQLGLKQSTAQRQNILRAAFSGQLVPQDPADEPASVLLERIRAERVTKDAQKRPRKPKKEPV